MDSAHNYPSHLNLDFLNYFLNLKSLHNILVHLHVCEVPIKIYLCDHIKT